MKFSKFEELEIWKLAISETKKVYDITSKNEFSKDYGLKDQIRRAIISVSSNIVEGFEKNNNNEFVRYLRIAKGSVGEVRNQLYIGLEIGYITKEEFDSINNKLLELANQIGAFLVYLCKKKYNNEFKLK